MFGRNYIDGSVKWLGVPDFLRNDGPPWNLNLLATYDNWGSRGSSTNANWGSGSGGNCNSDSVPWIRPDRVLPIYQRSVFENMRSAARRAHDDLLRENRTYCMHSLSTYRNPIRGRCSTDGMTAGIISRTSQLVNNLWG